MPPDVFSKDMRDAGKGIGVVDCICSNSTSGGEVAVAAGVAADSFVGTPVGALVRALVGVSVGTRGGVQVGVGETNSVTMGGPVTGSGQP